MKIDNKRLMRLVADINNYFGEYQQFSNDELRSIGDKFKNSIRESEYQVQELNSLLPKVYALVKETARRFSLGAIEVTANDYDKELATNFDFVNIVEDKALYQNSWFAGGDKFTWDMIHYDEQLLAGILLHQGYVTEMATGEGKTLVATLPVFLNALMNKGIHVMTVNDYLSTRDCELTRPLYMFHGLSVDCIHYSESQSIKRKKAYQANITFGTNSAFAFDYLFDHVTLSPKRCVQRDHYFALIDELDSILIDDAHTPHIIADKNSIDQSEQFKKYKPIIEELLKVGTNKLYNVNKIKHNAYFTKKGESWLSKRCHNDNLFQVKKISQVIDFKSLPIVEQNKLEANIETQNILKKLLVAYTLYEIDVDYIIETDFVHKQIIIVDKHTGRTKPKSRWEHGLHTAIEVKENVDIENETKSSAIISLKNFFKLYNRICGMSGTVMPVSKELKNTFGLKTFSIPTHNPLIRKDGSLRVFRNKIDKDKAIVKVVEELHKQDRPILIGCNSIRRAEEINQLLCNASLPSCLLSAKTLKKEAYLISKAGVENTITVSTSLAGRGTDIKLTAKSRSNGGLAVVGADIFESERIDRQLMGRAGRQGDPGSSVFFVSLEDFIVKNLSSREKNELDTIVTSIATSEISTNEVMRFINKAQSNRELYYFNLRKETARKDDTIATYRYSFYKKRNEFLHNPTKINEYLDSIFPINQERLNVDAQLDTFYKMALPLFERFRLNNKVSEDMSLPFSFNGKELYTIDFKIDEVIKNVDYFKSEFCRQTVLKIHDYHWKNYVRYLSKELNQTEIKELPLKFEEIQNEMDRDVILYLKNSTIPVGEINKALTEAISSDETRVVPQVSPKIGKMNLCPCGSGKNYGDCHGSDYHHKKFYRRK